MKTKPIITVCAVAVVVWFCFEFYVNVENLSNAIIKKQKQAEYDKVFDSMIAQLVNETEN